MTKMIRLKDISKELILDRIKFENPWWAKGHIDDEFEEMQRRLYFQLFYPMVTETDIRRALILMGPRRVGKTVLLHHSIEQLISDKVNPQKICFLSIDNPVYLNISLDEMFSIARQATGNDSPDGWYIFYDEIQYLKNWEQHLKVLVDSYPKTKFIASGSAAAALKLKSYESGAGRFTDFMLPPLTFQEYINLKGLDRLIKPAVTFWNNKNSDFYSTVNIKELNRHFIHYINFGGYPEVIFSEKIQANPGRYIKSDIIDKVLLRDLPNLYGIKDVQELNSFFSMLAYNSGNEVSLDSLAKSSRLEKNLIKKYLEYLEAAFLIKVIHRVDDNLKKFKRASFYKVILTNPSLRSALFSPIESNDENIGNMVETAIFAQWLHRDWHLPLYARWKNGEVDMVHIDNKTNKPHWAIEIKWSNRYYHYPGELKSLIKFCKKNNLNSAMVTSVDKEGVADIDDLQFHFYPAAVYAYAVGANTIDMKIKSFN